MSDLASCTVFYDTFEDREDAYRRLADFKLARRYGGPALFWKDFRSITAGASAARKNGAIASITSNPRDCLAFATAEQVLTAALMSAGESKRGRRAGEIASRFGIADVLTQPVRTLSGGESVKLALAKTYIAAPSSRSVVISSPFAWLSPQNRSLLEEVVDRCRRFGKAISVLALEGENDLTPAHPGDFPVFAQSGAVPFMLLLSGVRIPLTLSLNPLDESAPLAAIEDTGMELESPCLITGENGQGKSLVARALAGSLAMRGRAAVRTGNAEGRAGLLFQDVQSQTLMRSFAELAGGGAGSETGSIRSVYTMMAGAHNSACSAPGSAPVRPVIGGFDADLHTLLDVKAVLVAARLAAAPSALILDEPDWGLSRRSALRFVAAVTAAAHSLDIPVLLISHKPWWQPMIRSSLSVSRTAASRPVSADEPIFTVALQRGGTTW